MQTKCEIFTSLRDLVFLLLYHSKSSGFFFLKMALFASAENLDFALIFSKCCHCELIQDNS